MKLPGDNPVASRINSLETKPVRVAPGSAVNRRPDQAPGQPPAAAEAESDVKLTGRAGRLAAIEQSLRNLPAVDELRVAAVKQRLQDGEYQVDPQRIADRLLRMEDELARGPLERGPLK